LQATIPEAWNGNFTYLGSANGLNTGSGPVTMSGNISVAVNANNLTVGGNISDNFANLQLAKTGNGALTLPVGNSFGGGMILSSGLLNLGDPGAVGSGVFTINGGAIDNTSGVEFILAPSSSIWGGSFSVLGSTNLDLGGTISIPNGLGSITVDIVSNTLTTGGVILNNNTTVIKSGNGTWVLAGPAGGESLGLVVSAGEVVLEKSGGQAIVGGNNVGLTVQTNALVLNEVNFQIHSDSPIPVPVNLNGGAWDLNGFNENVDQLNISSGSTLRNGASASTSTLTLISGYPAVLTGANCQFDVVAADGILNINGVITGGGTLVKNGLGVLNLMTNETYSGNTIVNSGTLALPGVSSLSNTPSINLAATNSILDVSGNRDTNGNSTPVLMLLSGQTLSGVGSLNGLLQSANGATVAPGSAATIGTLTVTGTGTNILGGTMAMKLNKTGGTNDQLVTSGSLMFGGKLEVTNLSGALANVENLTLFNAVCG
jgi:autotransporter-associated beta strand protein